MFEVSFSWVGMGSFLLSAGGVDELLGQMVFLHVEKRYMRDLETLTNLNGIVSCTDVSWFMRSENGGEVDGVFDVLLV